MWRTLVYGTVEWNMTWIMRKKLLNISTWYPALCFGIYGKKIVIYVHFTQWFSFCKRTLRWLFSHHFCSAYNVMFQLFASFAFQWLTFSVPSGHLSCTNAPYICSFLKDCESLGLTFEACLSFDPSGLPLRYVGGRQFIHFHSEFLAKAFFLNIRALTSLCFSMYVNLLHTPNQ